MSRFPRDLRPIVLGPALAVSLLLPASGMSELPQTSPTPESSTIEGAFRDADGDHRPDRLGDTVTISGRATVASGVLHGGRLLVFLQDSTGGVQVFGSAVDEPIDRGDVVRATGTIDQYRGQAQLRVHDYRVAESGGGPPPPVPLSDLHSPDLEAYEGELVRISGLVTGRSENEGGDLLYLSPAKGDQRLSVFLANWRGRPLDVEGIDRGDRLEVTGLLGQFDFQPPYTSGYQLYPRTRSDVRRQAVLLGLTRPELERLGLAGLLLAVLGVGWWGVRSRREKKRLLVRYRRLFDQNLAGVFESTVGGKILHCNRTLAEIYGYDTPEDLTGLRFQDFQRDVGDREEYLQELMEQGQVRDYLHRHRSRDGEDLWLLESARLVEREGDDDHVVGTVVEVTDRIRAEREQKAAKARYRALFRESVAGAFRARPDGTLLEVNPAFAGLLGYDSPADVEGREVGEIYVDPEKRDGVIDRLRSRGRLRNEQVGLRTRDGDTVWALENSILLEDPATGEPTVLGTVTEITDRVEEERKLEALAHRDPLTGVPNRRFLEDAVPRILAQAQRDGDTVGVAYLDLDGFKEINDRQGHRAGDETLRTVAERLEDTVRQADLVARVGGDEFVIVLPGLEDKEDALNATRRQAERAFNEPVQVQDAPIEISGTLGVAAYPEDATEVEDLLALADEAMYRAVEEGKLVAAAEA